MPKYKVTIEFETSKPLRFPHDAQVLEAMQVQLESLEDGDISQQYKVSSVAGQVQEVEES